MAGTCGLAAWITAGCATFADEAREVSLAEFKTVAETVPGNVSAAETLPGTSVDDDAPAPPEDPPPPRPTPRRAGDRIVVDSLVGQVNGRPIFADEFLEPLADRLLAAAAQTTGRQRAELFHRIIVSNLRTVVENELILAEAESGLTVEEQRGLFALLRGWREEMIRKGRTRSGVEREVQRELGMTLDEYLDTQKQALLVRELARKRIAPRVIVSWRDVEREYQKRYEEFNPEARVTLARIRLHTNLQAEQIQEVQRRLDAGEPFAAVAEELGFENGGEWATFDMGPGGPSDIEVSPELKAALEGLEGGETTAPIVQGTLTLWLHVQAMDRPSARDLYDANVQRRLAQEIRARREDEEWNRYIDSLLEKGIYDELDEMADRLYRIAMDRYGR